ncbi:hypothetical protein JVU11DRAFT_7952 [Chiua virens]|nr:hypothetical protein JVU11DRAFT_7952 [Chiua virens]
MATVPASCAAARCVLAQANGGGCGCGCGCGCVAEGDRWTLSSMGDERVVSAGMSKQGELPPLNASGADHGPLVPVHYVPTIRRRASRMRVRMGYQAWTNARRGMTRSCGMRGNHVALTSVQGEGSGSESKSARWCVQSAGGPCQGVSEVQVVRTDVFGVVTPVPPRSIHASKGKAKAIVAGREDDENENGSTVEDANELVRVLVLGAQLSTRI